MDDEPEGDARNSGGRGETGDTGDTGKADKADEAAERHGGCHGGTGDSSGVTPAVTAGEAAAAQERSFWATRRKYHELDDDEAGRREKRRLSKQSRRMNLEVRMHRYARSHDEGRTPGDLRLPPLPDHETFPDENENDRESPS